MIKESIEKAVHDSDFLRDDISKAYAESCADNPVLTILLYDLIRDMEKIARRIREIKSVIT